MDALVEAAKATGHDIGTSSTAERRREDYVRQLSGVALEHMTKRWVTRFRVTPTTTSSSSLADAYGTIRKYRELAGDDDTLKVGLNHLVTLAGVGLQGVPYIDGPSLMGSPYIDGPAFGAPYIDGPAFGAPYIDGPSVAGRVPVTWLGRPPIPERTTAEGRRPVVAVLDTGLGRHGWLGHRYATLGATVNGQPIGVGDEVPDAEVTGIVLQPQLGLLDRESGHGTFIAGIIRQTYPDATVLAIRVMPSDGVVEEHQLCIALNKLLVRQAQAQANGTLDDVVDVMSLSLGYYHEDPEDVRYSSVFSANYRSFAALGVAVVTAAGNRPHDHSLLPGRVRLAQRASTSRPTESPAGQRRRAEPERVAGAVLERRGLGQLLPAGRQRGEHVAHGVRRQHPAGHRDPGRRRVGQPDTSRAGSVSGAAPPSPHRFSRGRSRRTCTREGNLDDVAPASMVERGWAALAETIEWKRPSS